MSRRGLAVGLAVLTIGVAVFVYFRRRTASAVTYRDGRKCSIDSFTFEYEGRSSPELELNGRAPISGKLLREIRFFGDVRGQHVRMTSIEIDVAGQPTLVGRLDADHYYFFQGPNGAPITLRGKSKDSACPTGVALDLSSPFASIADAPLRVQLE